ncbi:hypothetical protein ACL6C3_09340 [Capilliphycus salinus ALCB114379]|uniref:hypothetical protein n=1 Tax=Capilliphycus salinus TaxID=2768948 RepID=UPI0039A4BADB
MLPCMATLITPISVQAEIFSSNGNTDVFILEADAATSNVYQAQVIKNFDWFADADKIGLTGGLTEEDLDYMELIDFDEDGFLDDAVIKLKSTQAILGVVLNADDFVLEGEFIPITSSRPPITCLPKVNLVSCNYATVD